MSSCPRCNKATDPEAAACDCGELLRADVTNVGGWETETMFAAPRTGNSYRIAAIATILVIVSTVLALSWPQLQQRLLGTSESTTDLSTSNVSQNPLRSDIDPTEEPDDMITTESQQGAFEFAPGEHRPEISTRASLTLTGRSIAGSQHPTTDVVGGSNPLDAQLLTDNAAQNLRNANAAPDCKPEITLDLKRPDRPAAVAETKAAAKSADAKTYTLGPRGGCFYVTASGSKKYVDHSMCGQTAVAAARQ